MEGDKEKLFRRVVCTPKTRIRILGEIMTWANNTTSQSPNIYWLFGQAGSGKSTIAYTIARRFEFARDADDTIVLGGNFFCSRQFEETRFASRIIRTIVYHLALRCKAFADALNLYGKFESVEQNANAQLKDLLIEPWEKSAPNRGADSSYLIVIDALDEIDGMGGSEFLRDLLDAIRKHRLLGLKFFVTSRSDRDLITHVESFKEKEFCRLEEVPPEEAQTDIAMYLDTSLPRFRGSEVVVKLVKLAAGLFIYASTVVKYLASREGPYQDAFLRKLFSIPNATDPQSSSPGKTFDLLDGLYRQILSGVFQDIDRENSEWEDHLSILHTFLSTAEPTSTSIIAELLFSPEHTEVADTLLSHLHAVLYTKNGRVLSYHKSFSDFLFDKNRSGDWYCDLSIHQQRLTESCFQIMKGLQFNIANIPSSFILDHDNLALQGEVERNISSVLSYSCRTWHYHLAAAASTTSSHLCNTLEDFLHIRILFWIEAMNLLGFSSRCDPMLQVARKWVIKSTVSVVLAEQGLCN